LATLTCSSILNASVTCSGTIHLNLAFLKAAIHSLASLIFM